MRLIGLGAFDAVTQLVEHGDGMGRIRPDPAFLQIVDWHRIQVIPALPATPLNRDQAGFLQNPEMLHDRAAIDCRQRRTQSTGGPRAIRQQIQQLPTQLVAERLEKQIKCFLT